MSAERNQATRILIVDDEPAHVEAIRRALLRDDPQTEIRVAESLEGYHQAVAASTPDLVFLDYLLPDGRADSVLVSPPEAGAYPIVLMTSHGDEQVAVAAMRRGALDYIVKSPEAFAEMPRAVERTRRAWRLLQERREAQEALRVSEEQLRMALEAAQMGTFDSDLVQGRITWSRRHEELWGLAPGQFEGTRDAFLRQVHPDDRAGIQAEWERCLASRSAFRHEYRVVHPDGSLHWVESAGQFTFDAVGHPVRLRGTVVEVSQRRQAERFRALSGKVFTLLNQEAVGAETVQRILDTIKHETGFDAVGVRLRAGEDFPYHGSTGFSADFLAAENSLVLRTREGGLCRDAQGNVSLECTCGLILSGKTDPTHPLFTPAGSGWTNDARSFLHVPARQDPRLNPRNRCIHEGFQSVALIPIRVKGEIIGLMQLNDRRKGCFTLEMIQFFEGLAASFGVALLRRREEQALRESEDRYRSLIENSPDAVGICHEGHLTFVNSAAVRLLGGTSKEDLLGRTVGALVHPEDRAAVNDRIRRWLAGDASVYPAEARYLRLDGSVVPVEVTAALTAKGSVQYVARDITERKQAVRRAQQEAQRTELLLELHERSRQMTDRELYDYILEKAVQLTASEIGFFHQVSEDQSEIILTTWNQAALRNCTAAFDTHYPVREAGNWVECVRQRCPVVYNDYAHSPNQRGLPPGHAPVRRFMSIPVLREGKVRIIFGVGNKEADYDDNDVAQLQLVANELHKLMAHRAAQDQLRQLSQAVEQSPASIVITDRQGAIEYVNPKFTAVTGYTFEEVRGQNPRLLKSGEVPADVYRQLWETITQGREWRGEFRNRKKSGELFWERAILSPITDASGQITHFLAVKEDITALKHAQTRLAVLSDLGLQLNAVRTTRQAAEAILRAADALFGWDACRLDLYEAERNECLEVLARDTIAGQRVDCTGPSVWKRPSSWVRQVIDQGARLVLKDPATPLADTLPFGDTSRPSSSIMFANARAGTRVTGTLSIHSYTRNAYTPEDLQTFQALTDHCGGALERIRSEEALARSESRLRDLVETTFDWIWEVDAQGRYTYVSPKVQAALGYAPEEVLGRMPFDLMPEAEAQRVSAIFRETVARRKPFSALENTNRHKDGRLIVLETSGVPILGPDGELIGYRGMDRDITDRKRLESQLRQVQKLEAIGQLAGGIAHDFNNILAGIMMHLDLLLLSQDLPGQVRQALRDLYSEARRAASLTRQLLMFSRRSVLAVKPLDLNEVVANLLKMLGRLIGEHINLRFDGKTGLPPVSADAGMMEQVLMNLVVNARDAMPKSGRITISTALAEFGEPEIALNPNRREGQFACLAVSDTGCGMDEATLKRIFEPFFTTKEPGKGTGLGLATVHGIVAQHNGWVEVESQVGRGTSFRVFLPVVAQSVAQAPAAAQPEPLQRGRETILLVEDDLKVRQMVGQTLRILGYRVFEAANGQEAMKLWLAHGAEVELLLTDMVMPEGMTGLELAERLQAMRPGLKAIISSGYSAEIMHAGVPDKAGIVYLPKPYPAQTLAEIVRQCLDQKTDRKT